MVGLTTSFDVWKALSKDYSQDSQAREFELLLKLQEKKQDSVLLTDYTRNFKTTCDQLNAIGTPVTDQKKVFWLLNGLGPRYESFSTTMLKPLVPSYNDLIPLLYSHELRNKSLVSVQANPSFAFVGQHYSSQKRKSHSSFNSASIKQAHTLHLSPKTSNHPCPLNLLLQQVTHNLFSVKFVRRKDIMH